MVRSNAQLLVLLLVTSITSALTPTFGVFNSYEVSSVLSLFPTSLQPTVRSSFIGLHVAEPSDFVSAESVFKLLKLQSNMIAFIGKFSPVLSSIAYELGMQYFVIDIDSASLTTELLKIRQFIAQTSLSYVDQPSQWAFSSESASQFNNNTKVVSSKMAYLVPTKIMMYLGTNPTYSAINVTSKTAIFASNLQSAAAFFSSPLIFPYATPEGYIFDVSVVGTAVFLNSTANTEEIYYTLRNLRNNQYENYMIDSSEMGNVSTVVTNIPLDLGLLTLSRLWAFQRWSGKPTFVATIPDTPGWTITVTDAAYNQQAGSQNENLLYQVMLYLLNTALNVSSVSVLNNFNFNLYGPSISRFQDLQEYSIIISNSNTSYTLLWQTGVDILGRTTYITMAQSNASTGNETFVNILNYYTLAGLTVTIPLVVDPPFVLINSTTGQPYGMAIEIINHLCWYIGFNVNFVFISNYGSSTGSVKYLNQSTNATFLQQENAKPMAFALGGMYYTAGDAQLVSFITPFITPMGANLLMRNNTADTTWQFAQPLSLGVYICIAIIVILLPTAFSLLDLIVRNDPDKRLFSPAGSFWYVYGSLTLASVDTLPTRLSTKVLTLVMVFSFLILITAYQAGLITLYFFPRVDNNILNVSSLVTINQYGVNYPVLIFSGSVPGRYINGYSQSTQERVLQKLPTPVYPLMASIMSQLYQMNSTMNLLTVVNNYTGLLPALQANNNVTSTVVIGSNILNQWLQNQDCGLRIVGDPIDIRYISMATPLGAQYAPELSAALSALQANNTISNIINYYVVGTCPAAVGSFPLRIDDLAGVYYILACGFGVSLLVAITQRAYFADQLHKWKKRSRPLKFGAKYLARIVELGPEGAKIDIRGQPKLYVLPNRNFAPHLGLATSPEVNDIIVGDRIEVQYFGKDPASKSKLFVFRRKLIAE